MPFQDLISKDNINQLADYCCIDVGKLREYLCDDVIVPISIQRKIQVFFGLSGNYLMFSPHSSIPNMINRVSTCEAKEAILLADKISGLILFYRNAVSNGKRLEKEWVL